MLGLAKQLFKALASATIKACRLEQKYCCKIGSNNKLKDSVYILAFPLFKSNELQLNKVHTTTLVPVLTQPRLKTLARNCITLERPIPAI